MTDFLSRWPWRGPLYGSGPKIGSIPEMARIASDMAARHRLTVADLQGPSQLRHIAWPRQDAMASIYATGRYSLVTIGTFFGGRHYTTVLHAVRAVEKRATAPIDDSHTSDADRHLAALARSLALQVAA